MSCNFVVIKTNRNVAQAARRNDSHHQLNLTVTAIPISPNTLTTRSSSFSATRMRKTLHSESGVLLPDKRRAGGHTHWSAVRCEAVITKFEASLLPTRLNECFQGILEDHCDVLSNEDNDNTVTAQHSSDVVDDSRTTSGRVPFVSANDGQSQNSPA